MTPTPEICASRGPRIGEEGYPRCAQAVGHSGHHRGFEGSGFEREFWTNPVWRDRSFAAEWAESGREVES